MNDLSLLPYASVILLLLLSLVPISLKNTSGGSHTGKPDGFSFQRVLKPHVSYAFPGVDSLGAGGQQYYHVRDNIYCWDSPLPCMSETYHKFLNDRGYEIIAHRDGVRWEFVVRNARPPSLRGSAEE